MMNARPYYLLGWVLAINLALVGQVFGQGHQVAGQVTSAQDGSPLVGVNITVKGTDTGTTTDAGGRYQLAAPSPQDVLVFSYIGYQDEEVAINGRSNINVAMTSEAIAGEELVVIGYGTQMRRDVTSSIASLKEENFTQGATTDFQSLLQARVPGVVVTANNGDIGSEPQIRIRGGTSITAGNSPMIVIDGVPVSNNSALPGNFTTGGGAGGDGTQDNPLGMLNPNDIASIDVLKDASAAAIYGARGGNGVILITTKEGRPGDVSLTYKGYTSSSTVSKKLDLMDASEYKSYGSSIGATVDDGGADTDWQDAVFRTGQTQNHDISFGGGTQQTQYRASLNYLDQQGILLNSELQRYSARFNVRHRMLNDKLRLVLKLNPTFKTRNNTPYNQRAGYYGGVFTNVLKMNPTYPVHNADGSYYEYPTTTIRNPVALLNEVSDQGEDMRVFSSASAEYEVIPGLRGKVSLGLDREAYVRSIYEPNSLPYAAATGGNASVQNSQRQNVHFASTLNYKTDMGGSNLEAWAGYDFQEFTNSGFGAISRSFVTDAWLFNNLGGGADFTSAPYSYKDENRLISFFGRVNLNLAGRILASAALRREGSSRFGENNKWGVFPSASVGFRVNDDIKVRASYGITGNQDIGNYRSLVTLGPGANAVIGGQMLTGVAANQLANPDLKWETTSQMNLGADFGGLLGDKISGSVDVYSKSTKDLLLEFDVPQPAVVSTRLDNVGEVSNSGIEIDLTSVNISSSTLTWETRLNFTTNKNEVVSMGPDESKYIVTGQVGGAGLSGVQSQIIMKGQPLGAWFGFEFQGYDSDGQEILSSDGGPLGDGRKILGDARPDFTIGLSNMLTMGNIDVSVFIYAKQGIQILNNTRLEYQRPSNPFNNINLFSGTADDVADGLGAEAAVAFTDRFIEEGSFIRLQNITVGYRIDSAQFKNLRIHLSADNLFNLTSYTGFDPEVNTLSGYALGIDYTNYPRARTITLGIDVGL